ncbi:unnamed protein product [Durusdinium trenchii]|uniref:Uncharacterized protein n=1 Tax=Durusdinium trenchii TaxID=1381693 RepID=A0ABP0QNN3_9DINO
MPSKSLEMQVLKRGRQRKRQVDLAEDATVQDILAKLAQLSGAPRSGLFVAEHRNAAKVRLFAGEAPVGNFEVGGLESVEELPEVIHVQRQKVSMQESEALELLDELLALYNQADIQQKVKELQQLFLTENRDRRHYGLRVASTGSYACS